MRSWTAVGITSRKRLRVPCGPWGASEVFSAGTAALIPRVPRPIEQAARIRFFRSQPAIGGDGWPVMEHVEIRAREDVE